jgi:hypothetical protein
MAAPILLQQNFNANTGSLAFTRNVTAGSFLFALSRGQEATVSDNLNGAWTTLEIGEAQSSLPYSVAYLPVSKGGAITVTPSLSTSLTIAEISACVLTANSPVASGNVNSSTAVEFTSATIAAVAGQLLLGYAFITGSHIQSAGTGYTFQAVGTPPVPQALETQVVASSGNYNSDFFTSAPVSGTWGTGILALTSTLPTGSWLSLSVDSSMHGLRK